MEYENHRPVVGKKQILRLAKENELKYIQIAADVEDSYAQDITAVANRHNVRVEFLGTRQQIAETYGIEVPCGAVGFLKD